jgi:hypothetical protein
VELNCPSVVSRAGFGKVVRFHRLTLVESSKVELSRVDTGLGGPIFAPTEMRHDFAIWPLKEAIDFSRQRHLYYCIRCKETFSVDHRSGSVTPLDARGDPILGTKAAKRLATFAQGPCPAFNGLIANPECLRKVVPIQTLRGRFTKLILACRRTWKAVTDKSAMQTWRRSIIPRR